MTLVKMEPEDDPQAFLLEFECAAEESLWPKEQWAARLAPLLSMEAQAVYKALPSYIAKDYDRVKDAILDHLGVSEESYRKKFRSVTFAADAKPRDVARQLHGWCWKWLKPDMRNPAEVVELIILEQYIQILPAGAREWLRHCPVFSLDSFVQMIEDYFNVEEVQSATCDGHCEEKAFSCEEDQMTEGIVTVKPEMISVFEESEARSFVYHQNEKGREGSEEGTGSSVGDLELSVVKVKIEEEEEPSAIDLQESMGRVKIEKDLSGWEHQDSLVQMKIEVDQELTAIDIHNLMDEVTVEEWEQTSRRYFHDSESLRDSSAGKRPTRKCNAKRENMIGKRQTRKSLLAKNEEKAQQIVKLELEASAKQWPCSECDKTFGRLSQLSRHRREHLVEMVNRCDECGKGFLNSRLLYTHQLTHAGQFPYLCVECGESFCDPPAFLTHQKTHPLKKPYVCPDCGKGFTTKAGMTVHWQRKHGWCEMPYK